MSQLFQRHLLIALAAFALTGAGWAAPADSVVGDGTPGSCTQGALNTALAGGGLVTFACGGPKTIQFSSPTTLVASAILEGGGIITLTGNTVTRLFNVPASFSFTLRNIVLDQASSGASDGGAISNHGRLTLENSTIQKSQADNGHSGGAIFTDGPLTLTNVLLEHNMAGSGGAVFANTAAAVVTVTGGRLTNNQAQSVITGYGGAVWVGTPARLSLIAGGAVTSNTANFGGAFYVSTGGGLDLAGAGRLPVLGNTSAKDGGAIYTEAGSATRLARLDLIGNHATAGFGGAVFSRGALAVDDSLFRANQSNSGGGLAAGLLLTETSSTAVPVTITHSLFQSNTVPHEGGGVYLSSPSTVITITDTAFDGNHAGAGGGGLTRYESGLSITRASFTHNDANNGGGLVVTYDIVANANGYVTVRDTTFSGNTASTTGGAVQNQDVLQLINATLKGNSSGFANNPGDINVNGRLRGAVLQNTGPNCENGVPTDDGNNYATDTSCAFNNSQQGALLNPMLGPLSHGPAGLTSFHLPLPGSPLINQGPINCSPVDQRGAARVGQCDIGAVEFGGQLPWVWLPFTHR